MYRPAHYSHRPCRQHPPALLLRSSFLRRDMRSNAACRVAEAATGAPSTVNPKRSAETHTVVISLTTHRRPPRSPFPGPESESNCEAYATGSPPLWGACPTFCPQGALPNESRALWPPSLPTCQRLIARREQRSVNVGNGTPNRLVHAVAVPYRDYVTARDVRVADFAGGVLDPAIQLL